MHITTQPTIKGSYTIKRYRSIDLPVAEKIALFNAGKLEPFLIETLPTINNIVSTATNHGLNIIAQNLTGIDTYPIEITQAKIGTGTNTPAATDTDLQTAVLSGILRANQSSSGPVATLSFFINDGDLSNGTYNEFGIFCGNQLFARSLISPAYTKASGEDTTIEYTITFSNG